MRNPLQLSLVNYKKGAYIIVEGKQDADYFYIIRSGNVRISKEVEVVEEEGGNILAPGDFFGVVSTMSSHRHIENAQAVTDVSLISVHRDQYGLLIERNAPVAMKIIQSFSKRMRYLDEALAHLALKSKTNQGESPRHLFKVAEYYVKQSQYNQAYYAYYQFIVNCPDDSNADVAKERMAKIKPYAQAVYLDGHKEDFTRQYPKNTMIFSEGQPGKELYIIQKGSVKITKIVDNNEVLLAVLKPGDIFGEMSLLEDKPRSASAIAYEDSVLLAVNKENFERMVSTQPQMIARLTKLLAERIYFMYKQLANTQLTNPLARLWDMLFINLEKLRVSVRLGESYLFDFGPRELLNMVGLPAQEGDYIIKQLFANSKIRLTDNKIFATDVVEVEKQAAYFRKMEQIERARKRSSIR